MTKKQWSPSAKEAKRMEALVREQMQSYHPSGSFRKKLLKRLHEEQFGPTSSFAEGLLGSFFQYSLRLSVAALVLLSSTGAAGYYVYTSPSITPGSDLYAFRLAMESIELNLVRWPLRRSQTHLKFANRRLREVAANPDDIDQRTLDEANKQLQAAEQIALSLQNDHQRSLLQRDIVQTAMSQRLIVEALLDEQLPEPQTMVAIAIEPPELDEEDAQRVSVAHTDDVGETESSSTDIIAFVPVEAIPPKVYQEDSTLVIDLSDTASDDEPKQIAVQLPDPPKEDKAEPKPKLEYEDDVVVQGGGSTNAYATQKLAPNIGTTVMSDTVPVAMKVTPPPPPAIAADTAKTAQTVTVLEQSLQKINETELTTLNSIESEADVPAEAIAPPMMDLVIKPESVGTFIAEQTGVLKVQLHNNSSIEIPATTLEVRWGTDIARLKVKALAPQQKRTEAFHYVFVSPGTYNVTVIADPDKTLNEKTKANNRFYTTIIVQPVAE